MTMGVVVASVCMLTGASLGLELAHFALLMHSSRSNELTTMPHRMPALCLPYSAVFIQLLSSIPIR